MRSEMMLFLDMLERSQTPFQLRDVTRPDIPKASHQIEVENSGNYGEQEATSVWLFDTSGSLIRVGHFAN